LADHHRSGRRGLATLLAAAGLAALLLAAARLGTGSGAGGARAARALAGGLITAAARLAAPLSTGALAGALAATRGGVSRDAPTLVWRLAGIGATLAATATLATTSLGDGYHRVGLLLGRACARGYEDSSTERERGDESTCDGDSGAIHRDTSYAWTAGMFFGLSADHMPDLAIV
jgi:hypothetical protein